MKSLIVDHQLLLVRHFVGGSWRRDTRKREAEGFALSGLKTPNEKLYHRLRVSVALNIQAVNTTQSLVGSCVVFTDIMYKNKLLINVFIVTFKKK